MDKHFQLRADVQDAKTTGWKTGLPNPLDIPDAGELANSGSSISPS